VRARLGLLIVVFVLTLGAGAACGGNGSERGSVQNDGKGGVQGAIKIGALVPFSGANAEYGPEMLNAARLAADDLNASGGVLGRRIEIVSEDDGCDAQTAAAGAEKLLASGIVGVAGGFCSGAVIPATEMLDPHGIPYVSAFATNPAVTERGLRTVFRVVGRDDRLASFAVRFLAGPGGTKKLALLHDNSVYAKGLAELIRSANDDLKLGMQIVFFDAVTPGQPDYSSVLTAIKASGADTLYFTGYPAEAGVIVRQTRALALPFRVTGGDTICVPSVISAAGAAAEGLVSTIAPLPEFLPSAGAFVQAYTERFGRAPGAYSVYEYDAVRVLANAIFWAGSTDPKDIVEALRTNRYQGLMGEISFDAKGDRQTAVHVTAIVRGGKCRPYKKLDARGTWVDG
jgi:branched-chain amino acid transport system substrate-binding protein